MFIACIWCAVSPNISSIGASRVFQGFGMSALQRYYLLSYWSLSLVRRSNSTSIAFSLQPSSKYFCRSIWSVFPCCILLPFSIHERGSRSVIWGFSIMSGITLSIMSWSSVNSVAYCWYYRGPLLYSYAIQNLSWQMGFWFVTIPLGICLLLVFFFVPEVRQSIIFCNITMIANH